MYPIEQAFIQVRLHSGHWTANIQGATPGNVDADLHEIADWFTAPDNGLLLQTLPWNLFFHPLPSGRYALGIVYSIRQRFFAFRNHYPVTNVRVLLVSPQTLLGFQNHPILLFETLRNQGKLPLTLEPPHQFLPLLPEAVPFVINAQALESAVKMPGEMAIAQLFQSLFNAEYTFFTSKAAPAISVLTALFDLLPIRYRPELTFSTNLFFSLKHSFRLSGFSGLRQQAMRIVKQLGIPIIFLEKEHKGSLETLDPWSRFVFQVLHNRNYEFVQQYQSKEYLAAALTLPEPAQVNWQNLHELGVTLNKSLLSGTLTETDIPAAEVNMHTIPMHTLEELRVRSAVDQMLPMMPASRIGEAKRQSAQRLAERFPNFQNELTALEAYLVRAIFGDDSVLPPIKKLWNMLLPRLDLETKEMIQEEITATIHAVQLSVEGGSEKRLRRSKQLLDLMLFFLNPESS